MKRNKILRFSRILGWIPVFLLFQNLVLGQAQNNPSHEDDRIYLQIKDTSSAILKYPITQNPIPPNLGRIYSLFAYYKVSLIELPFASLGTRELKKTYRITFDPTFSADDFVEDLTILPIIEYAEKIPKVYPLAVIPDDPSVTNDNTDPLKLTRAYEAFDISKAGAKIAIVDDAVLTTHEDLRANMALDVQGNIIQRDVADNDDDANPPFLGGSPVNGATYSHGTSVAGIAAATTNNGIGVASIGWNNQIIAIKSGKDKLDKADDPWKYVYDGITWAAEHGAQVINLSWGGQEISETDYNIIKAAKDKGIIIVAGAGNSDVMKPFYPAAYGEGLTGKSWEILDKKLVIAVASIDTDGKRSRWGKIFSGSSFGHWVDIAAYGTNIKTTKANSDSGNPINNQYDRASGTSFASPMVAGLLGSMIGYSNGRFTSNQIIECLLSSANADIYTIHGNVIGTLGSGRIDAVEALRCLTSDCKTNNTQAFIYTDKDIICPKSTLILRANEGTAYKWSNGATTQSISITTSGIYTVVVTYAGGCTSMASKTITLATANLKALVYEQSGKANDDGILCLGGLATYSAPWGLKYDVTPNAFYYVSHSTPQVVNFSVKVTSVYGCIGLDQIVNGSAEWVDIPNEKISVIESSQTLNDGIICPNFAVTLSVPNKTGFTYLWSTGAKTNSIKDNPDAETIYTLTVTNTNGCSQIVTSTIKVQCDNIVFTKSNKGCGDLYHFESTNPIGIYEWKFGDGTTSTEASPSVYYSKSGNYIVELKHTIGTVVKTYSYIIKVNSPEIVLKKNISFVISQNILPTGAVINKNFTVSGTFEIDRDYSFSGCHFMLTEGAKIEVKTGRFVNFVNCTFKACEGKLWQGVVLQKQSSIYFIGNNIKNANTALSLTENCTIKIIDNMFYANEVGIYTEPSATGAYDIIMKKYISGNTFRSSYSLLPGTYKFGGYPKSYAGIFINDVSAFSVGGYLSKTNKFEYMHNAIIGKKSVLSINDANIKDMQYFGGNGTGIFMEQGISDIADCTIDNATTAIHVNDENTEMKKNVIKNVDAGVNIYNCSQKSTLLANNNIDFKSSGISSVLISNPIEFNIHHNNLDNSIPLKYGIWWFTHGIGAFMNNGIPNLSMIADNTINMGASPLNTRVGVLSWFSGNLSIIKNKINLKDKASLGIYLAGETNDFVANNNIVGDISTFNSSTFGIAIDFAQNTKLQCNKINKTEIGVRIAGFSKPTTIKTTTLETHHSGISLVADAIIGRQDHFGNDFTTTAITGAEAFHDSNNKNIIAESEFLVTQGTKFTPNPIVMPNVPASTKWFTSDNQGSQVCEQLVLTNTGTNETVTFDETDEKIADATLYAGSRYENAMRYEAEQDLYMRLEKVDRSVLSGTLQNFYQVNQNTILGKLHDIKQGVEKANKGSLSFRNNQILQLSIIDSLKNRLKNIDVLINSDNVENEATLFLQRKNLVHSIRIVFNNMQNEYKNFAISRNDSLYYWLAENANLEYPNNLISDNVKLCNEVQIELMMQDDYYLSRIDWQALKAVAEQCPYKGGSAVYRARAMYRIKDIKVNYDDANTCNTGHKPSFNTHAVSNNFEVLVAPNPSNDYVKVSWNSTQTMNVVLSDILGRELIHQTLAESSEVLLDVSNISNGIYNISVNSTDNSFKSINKIIIQH